MFLIYCNNKGCGTETEALLDTDTDQVHCAKCSKQIDEVNSFTKASMRTMGQIKRVTRSQLAFSIACEGCKRAEQPELKNNQLLCPFCKLPHTNIPGPYAHAVKQFLTSGKNKQ